MKRLSFLLLSLTLLQSCKEKAIDLNKRVRPVRLQITVNGGEYKLSWEGIRLICITSPCPDIADVEAQEYEVQIATEELGIFRTYRTFDAAIKTITIPTAGRGEQLLARIVSKASGAPPVYSVPVMATNGFLSQSVSYPGFGSSINLTGEDVTTDGSKSTFNFLVEETPGKYTTPLYLATLRNEQIVSTKLINPSGWRAKFSASGQQLAFNSGTENGLAIYDLASGLTRILTVSDAARIAGLDWSPDGKWLAYLAVSETESQLWKIAVAGGVAVPLTPPLPFSELNNILRTDIHWSPDGQYIAVSRARSDAGGKEWRAVVSLYSPEGKGELKYFDTQPGWIDKNPTFSPDGKQIAFLSTRTDPSATSHTLWVRDLITGKVRRIELLPGLTPSDDYLPHWLGNERLLFMGTQQGVRGYFTVFL
jgi:Tol biopolymer transport system component